MNILRSPDATASSGGESGEDLFEGGQGEEATTATTTAESTGAGTQTGTTDGAGASTGTTATEGATTSSLSKDDVESILAGALAKVGATKEKTTTTAPAKEWTQEDFERTFNVLKFSPELLAQLRHETPEVALKAFEQIRDGMIRQAMTMAEYRVQQLMKELRDTDIAPIQSFVNEQQATSFRNDFFKEYADLEQYETIVDAVAAKLQQSGYNGGSRADVMKKYAEETNKIVTQLTAGQAKANGGTTSKPAPAGKNRMSTLTGGGQNTTGGAPAAGAKGPPGIEVFD